MVSFSSVLMAPVNGIVWVVKLPFVLVWMLLRYVCSCIYAVIAAVLRVPAHYLGRVGTRLKLMWTWTKTSAGKIKLCLPFFSNFSNPLSESGMKSLPPPPGHEYGSYYVYSENTKPYPHSPEEARSSRRRRHSNRRNRKAVAAALAKLLLESPSPSDSDEDNEVRAARSSQPEEGEERTVKLIMDLLKISKTEGDPQITGLTPRDLQTLKEHARDKRQLESLIAEVDKAAREVDSSLLLTSRQQQSSAQPASPKSKRLDQHQQHKSHKSDVGSSSTSATSHGAKKTRKVSDDVDPACSDEKDKNEGGGMAGEEPQHVAPHHHKYTGNLSPVQESPEYKPEELNYKELEKDLNLALSRLNSEISELHVDETVREESVETQVTRTVTVTNAQKLSDEEEEGLFQDSHEEFPSVPKVNPSLGLKAGHDRRDLAAARRPRPPTRKAAATAQQGTPSDVSRDKRWKPDKQDDLVSEDSWDDDSDLNGSEENEGEEGGDDPGRKRRPKQFVGGLQLSDQLQLLSPTSKSQMKMTSEEDDVGAALSKAATEDVSSLYAKVDKKKKSGARSDVNRPRTGSDPTSTTTGQSALTSRGSSHSVSADYGERELVKEKDRSGHSKLSAQPPWVEMRSSEISARATTTHLSTAISSQPPWIEMRSPKGNSGHPSPASTSSNAPQLRPSHMHSTPQPAPQSITTATAAHSVEPHRVLPPKPSIPRPDPPTDSSSAPLIQPYLSEEENRDDGVDSDENSDNYYDTLQPKEEVLQCESRIFPLDETHLQQEDRPRYLHEVLAERERNVERSDSSRSRRAGSVSSGVKDASPALSLKSSASKLKRTSSADTVGRPAKKGHDHIKERHSSSSSLKDGGRSRGRSDERWSSDDHRHRHQSSSSDRTPSRGRHHSSEKRGSSQSSKGSPSPKESTTALSAMWKLLATPTSSRKHHSSSSKDSSSSKKSGERDAKRHHSSSRHDNSPSSKD